MSFRKEPRIKRAKTCFSKKEPRKKKKKPWLSRKFWKVLVNVCVKIKNKDRFKCCYFTFTLRKNSICPFGKIKDKSNPIWATDILSISLIEFWNIWNRFNSNRRWSAVFGVQLFKRRCVGTGQSLMWWQLTFEKKGHFLIMLHTPCPAQRWAQQRNLVIIVSGYIFKLENDKNKLMNEFFLMFSL